ncbi:MarR family transcriptional regulator [Salibacteraceae bacterium]|jgi:DNA-binding MarR family transcriptional regulator|nr:MarR family transcriptional regulator [Salibacteraceae bacterium]
MDEDFELDDFLGHKLGVTYLSLVNLFQKKLSESGIGITVEQAKVLNYLHHKPGCNQNDLCCALRKDKPAISRTIEGLEKVYLIFRKEDEEDRRNKRLFLTEDGEVKYNELAPIRAHFFDMIHSSLSEEELSQTRKTLQILWDAMQEEHKKYS